MCFLHGFSNFSEDQGFAVKSPVFRTSPSSSGCRTKTIHIFHNKRSGVVVFVLYVYSFWILDPNNKLFFHQYYEKSMSVTTPLMALADDEVDFIKRCAKFVQARVGMLGLFYRVHCSVSIFPVSCLLSVSCRNKFFCCYI